MTPNLDVAVNRNTLVRVMAAADGAGFRGSDNCLRDVSGRGSEIHIVPEDGRRRSVIIEGFAVARSLTWS